MPPIPPKNVIFPLNRIKQVVDVLHDGTITPNNEFSIAKIELRNGETVFGLRHDLNYWNSNTPDKGYPTVRPGNPTWFILPDNIDELINVLNSLKNSGKFL